MWIDDQILEQCPDQLACKLWLPERMLVVLGRSNQSHKEADEAACQRDAVSIVKRLGGGGTVLLHSGCLVLSIGCWVREIYRNDHYFRLLNQSVMDTIRLQLPALPLEQRGFSDIVYGQRKLAGTSLFRSRNYLLYQASLLIEPRLDAIERYLCHPSAEPDYRQGRRHRDFMMGLEELSPWSPELWLAHFSKNYSATVQAILSPDLIPPPPGQIEHVLSRRGEIHN